jgi:hypothetical protein
MSDPDDITTGMGALLGRSIGELNGLQRRVDLLEKQMMNMQEHQQARSLRREFRWHAAFVVFQLLIVVGLIAGLSTWPAIRSVL